MNAELSWKDKYFQELKAAEHRDQQWQQQRLRLERMLVRISLGLKGQTAELICFDLSRLARTSHVAPPDGRHLGPGQDPADCDGGSC
jgi:hypothetical protein